MQPGASNAGDLPARQRSVVRERVAAADPPRSRGRRHRRHADGTLAEGDVWRQDSVLGGVYEASVRRRAGAIVPSVKGRAWITAESELSFESDDPYRTGITR